MNRKEDAEIGKIYDEILWLLIAAYVYKHMNVVKTLPSMDRYDLGDYIFSVKTVFESIILRICRLDDDNKGVWSFYEARKRLAKVIREQRSMNQISAEMKTFRQMINPIKTRLRNDGIAHTMVNSSGGLGGFDLRPILASICKIGDLMAGDRQNYTYSCGRYEKVDLREFFAV